MTDTYLICLDPESIQIYSIGLLSRLLVVELDVPLKIQEKVIQTCRNIQELEPNDGTTWWIKSSQYHIFKKRMIPKYLLQPDSPAYPRHLQFFDLGTAFMKLSSLEIEIDLTKYWSFKNEVMKTTCPERLVLTAPLATGADEAIKKCVRQIYREYKIKLHPLAEENRLTFKVVGSFEYLYGDFPLINYNCVRVLLRDCQRLRVKLAEMPYKLYNPNYPPMVKRGLSDVINNKFGPIPWEKFEDQPLIVWYPPVKLSELKKEKNGIAVHIPYNNDENRTLLFPRASLYYTMNEFQERRKYEIKESIATYGEGAVSYSGELDFPFRIKIQGLETLNVLMEQAKKQQQYLDSNMVLRSSTKDHNVVALDEIAKNKDQNTMLVAPKLAKVTKSLTVFQQEETLVSNKFHMDQGNGAGHAIRMQKAYEFISFPPFMVSIEISIFLGNKLLDRSFVQETSQKPFTLFPRWSEWVYFNGLKISSLPLETRLCFNVKIYSQKGEQKIIGCTYLHLFDIFGKIKTGLLELNLWPFTKTDPDFVCTEDFGGLAEPPNKKQLSRIANTSNFAKLVIQLESFALPVFWSLGRPEPVKKFSDFEEVKEELSELLISKKKTNRAKSPVQTYQQTGLIRQLPTTEELAMLQVLSQRDGIVQPFTETEKEVIFKCRHHYKTLPKGLAIFLISINWSKVELAMEAYRMLQEWSPPEPEEALSLLNAQYGNEAVRAYAIERISVMSDDDLALFMPQLVMALAYEPSHLSFLGEFLLERALANPFVVGNQFYWQLRSRLHVRASHERYLAYLEQFVMLAGNYRQEILNQIRVNKVLTQVGINIKHISNRNEMISYYKNNLYSLNCSLKEPFSFPLDTRMRSSEFIEEECSIKESKNLPCMLSAKNSEKESSRITVMFEMGDFSQLRVILEFINLMDKLWLENGLDLCVKTYKAIPISGKTGLIEIVRNSDSITSLQRKETLSSANGGSNFMKDFLGVPNGDSASKDRHLRNFIGSAAGYCIIVYVLGIEDRTWEDMMISKQGYFSIINLKSFLGYNRGNKNPKKDKLFFSQIVEIVQLTFGRSSDSFKMFVELCIKGYRIIRKYESFLVGLLTMMLPAGMENLTLDGIRYLQDKLAVYLTNEDATIKFREEIMSCLSTNANILKKLDNFVNFRKKDSD